MATIGHPMSPLSVLKAIGKFEPGVDKGLVDADIALQREIATTKRKGIGLLK